MTDHWTLTAAEAEPDHEPEKIDFNSPEDVLIEVVHNGNLTEVADWKQLCIESTTVLNGADGIMGAASYDHAYGGFLDYTIQDMIECPGEGWFVVEGITGNYIRGDGYTTDDDMDFDYKSVRPATAEEIAQA